MRLSVGSWGGGERKTSIPPPLKKGMVLAQPIPMTGCEDWNILRNKWKKDCLHMQAFFFFFNCLRRLYEILDLNGYKGTSLSSCKTEEEDGRCSPGRSRGTDVWFHSEKCSFYQSVEIKMLLPLLQFGREHRGGGGQNVSGNPGQRTQGRTDGTQLWGRAAGPHTQRSHSHVTEEGAPGILQTVLEEGSTATEIYWWWQHTEQIPNHKTPMPASVQTDIRQKQPAIQNVIVKPEIWAQPQLWPLSKDQSSQVSQ